MPAAVVRGGGRRRGSRGEAPPLLEDVGGVAVVGVGQGQQAAEGQGPAGAPWDLWRVGGGVMAARHPTSKIFHT